MTESRNNNPQAQSLDSVIGTAVKNGRKNAGKTLTELSQASGVSTAMISKIERGQVSGSISTLQSLAEAIGVPIINFFAETVEHREISYVRSGEGITVQRSGSTYGHAYKMIGKVNADQIEFETFLITLNKSANGEPVFQHRGVELIRMEKGSMIYRCGDKTFTLEPGDCLSFETEAPHGPISLITPEVVFLTVIARSKS
jgi:transcriptional regulator with XRE-family HTH domain